MDEKHHPETDTRNRIKGQTRAPVQSRSKARLRLNAQARPDTPGSKADLDGTDVQNHPEPLLRCITVLSLEQAIALPYCTWRLALEGARVIRVEPLWGDPNRKVGPTVLSGDAWSNRGKGESKTASGMMGAHGTGRGEEHEAGRGVTPAAGRGTGPDDQEPVGEADEALTGYFMAVNTSKESITLNLGKPEGQRLLGELIVKLEVDVFASNQIPTNYAKLGIDYERLSGLRPELIWLGVSGFGPHRSEAAYDPMIQAYSGLSFTNGEPGSPPQKFGVSIADFEAANQAYTEVCKALWQRDRTGRGRRIDVSMLDCSLSLLALHISMESLGHHQEKSGNGHPIFAPVGVYQTADGHLCLATGNEAQWNALCDLPGFEALDRPEYATTNLRQTNKRALEAEVSACFARHPTALLMEWLNAGKVPAAPVHTIAQTLEVPDLARRLLGFHDPATGLTAALAPPPVAPDVPPRLTLPPRLGEQNNSIFGGLGYDVGKLREQGLIG